MWERAAKSPWPTDQATTNTEESPCELCASKRARDSGGAGCLGIKSGTWMLGLYTRAVRSRLGNCVLKFRRMIITTDPTQSALGGGKEITFDSYMAACCSRTLCLRCLVTIDIHVWYWLCLMAFSFTACYIAVYCTSYDTPVFNSESLSAFILLVIYQKHFIAGSVHIWSVLRAHRS